MLWISFCAYLAQIVKMLDAGIAPDECETIFANLAKLAGMVNRARPKSPGGPHAPNRIRELRKAQRLSQEALAARVGLSHQQISKLENSLQRCPLDHLLRVAKALGVSPEELLPGSMRIREEDRALLAVFQKLNENNRRRLIEIARIFQHEDPAAAA